MKKLASIVLILNLLLLGCSDKSEVGKRWSVEKANEWYAKQPWLVGCNFIPSTAINQLEMWQEDTFDPETIDRELGWAEDLGFNVMRVYLHDLAYNQDPDGFLKRIDQYLDIADSHGIKTMFVIFDDCWLDDPKPGKQPEPWPRVHGSGWLQSPGLPQLKRYPTDKALRQRLEKYTKAVMKRYSKDERVLMWDLYNEPSGWWYRRGEKPGEFEKGLTDSLCLPLLDNVYTWARQVDPSQPLTTCWNRGAYEVDAAFNKADIVTFHIYGNAESLEKRIAKLKEGTPGRPMICTEYLNRPGNCQFETYLPVLAKNRIGAINWGLVAGKTHTIYGWRSWENLPTEEPKVWCHDILRKDGTPFDEGEADFIRAITKQARETQQINRKGQGNTSHILQQLDSPILLGGNDTTAYRDPAAVYHDGTFYLFFTLVQTEEDGKIYSYIAESTSRDLKNWSEPKIITPKGQHLNFCGPGNIIRFNNEWLLCLSRYPRLDYRRGDKLRWADQNARAYIIRSKDLHEWGTPELLRLKGPEVSDEAMGRIIDPYIVQDKDEPGKWWCFFKFEHSVNMSWSNDLKNWTYVGRTKGGENACVLVDGDEYVLFHSPHNGMGMKRSPDLKQWRDVGELITLGQKDWSWAEMRLTAGCVLDLRHEPAIGKYLMFFHGGGPGKTRTQDNADANCCLGIAWSDDLKKWSWPTKQ